MKICPTCLGRYDDEQERCPDDDTALRHIHVEDATEDRLLGRALDGRWLVEEKIGEGGMGAVYRGQQTSVGRPVAIKTLRGALADTQEYVERFFREANVASTLNHPHCVTIYDFGQDRDDHVLYLTMEYLEGRSLHEELRQRRVSLREALTIGVQLCSALAAAHGAKIVHRDLKPDNIFLVDVPGGELFIKVLDFGIAKHLESKDTPVTRTGQIFGTPAYMSPEQCQSADVDPRSDLYSVGVILYELVSGRPPFCAETPLKTLLAHVSSEAEPPSHAGISVPEGVEAIIMRLLEKDPDERFGDALEVREALEAQLDELPADVLDAVPSRPRLAEGSEGTLLLDDSGDRRRPVDPGDGRHRLARVQRSQPGHTARHRRHRARPRERARQRGRGLDVVVGEAHGAGCDGDGPRRRRRVVSGRTAGLQTHGCGRQANAAVDAPGGRSSQGARAAGRSLGHPCGRRRGGRGVGGPAPGRA